MAGRHKKSTSVKQRTIYVYVPQKEIADLWKKAAKKLHVSVSNFVQEAVEFYLANQSDFSPGESLGVKYKKSIEVIEALKEENQERSRKLIRMDTLLDRYEKQVQDLEQKKFLHQDFQGTRSYNKRLIELFREKQYLTEEMIMDSLHISPSNVQGMQVVNIQISNLLEYGIIIPYKGGFLWKQ